MKFKRLLIGVCAVMSSLYINAQCSTAVTTLVEGFESTSIDEIPICWSVLTTEGIFDSEATGVRNTDDRARTGDRYFQHYAGFETLTEIYLITPLLNSMDGNYFAEFYVNQGGGTSNTTFEYGTMTDPTDVASYTSLAAATIVPADYTQISTSGISLTGEKGYFAIKVNTVTAFAVFRIDDFMWRTASDALPIELTNFKVKTESGQRNIEWSVANASNVQDFTVEFTKDNKDFLAVNTISSKVNSATKQTYQITDTQHHTAGYYRLCTTFLDGTLSYSPLVFVAAITIDDVVVAPNPTTGYVRLLSNTVPHRVDIYNSVGQLVKRINSPIKIDLAELEAGIYYFKMLNTQQQLVQQQCVIKQ